METVFLLEISGEVVSGDELFWSPGGFHLTRDPNRGLIPHNEVRRVDTNRLLYRHRETNATFRPDQVVRCLNGYLIVGEGFYPFALIRLELLPEYPRISAIVEKIAAQSPYDDLMSVVRAPPGERAVRRQELSSRSGQILTSSPLNPFGGLSPDRLVHRNSVRVSSDSDLDLEGSDPPDASSSIAEAGFPGVRAKAFPMSTEVNSLLKRFPSLKSRLFPSHLDHPNQAYCPDLFDPMRCPQRSYEETDLIGSHRILFPGFDFRGQTDWQRFEETWLFFMAVGAPPDWEDTYGETFETRSRVYAYVRPGHPDEMEFFSAEELTTSFLNDEDFVNPKSGRGQRLLFSTEQINCLQALLEARDVQSPLRQIIQDLRSSRLRITRQMRELSTRPHFRECLALVLEVAMKMRGWPGSGPYPLRSGTTGDPVDHVALSIRLAALRNRLEGDWVELKAVQLINYRGRAWVFEEARKTLYERLLPVMTGELCIRQTSAIFAWTVWYYSNEFFGEPPFVLGELEYIN